MARDGSWINEPADAIVFETEIDAAAEAIAMGHEIGGSRSWYVWIEEVEA